jgi:hypothetical protein
MDARYAFVLDMYPILETFPPEASLLVMRLEQSAFNLLFEKETEQLTTLLSLSRDLGYLDDRLFFFLEKRLGML